MLDEPKVKVADPLLGHPAYYGNVSSLDLLCQRSSTLRDDYPGEFKFRGRNNKLVGHSVHKQRGTQRPARHRNHDQRSDRRGSGNFKRQDSRNQFNPQHRVRRNQLEQGVMVLSSSGPGRGNEQCGNHDSGGVQRTCRSGHALFGLRSDHTTRLRERSDQCHGDSSLHDYNQFGEGGSAHRQLLQVHNDCSGDTILSANGDRKHERRSLALGCEDVHL